MPSPSQHSALFRNEREKVTRPDQILWHGFRINNRSNGPCAFLRTDPRSTTDVIDRNGERSMIRSRVHRRIHHLPKLKPTRQFGHDRHTELATTMGDHKLHNLGRHLVGCSNEISLVFAGFVINNDHHPAFGQGFQCIFHAGVIQVERHTGLQKPRLISVNRFTIILSYTKE